MGGIQSYGDDDGQGLKKVSADGKEGPKPPADEPFSISARMFGGLSGSRVS